MTTIISLAARDFIVVGCDSLATTSLDLAFPYQLTEDFFDNNGNLKLDSNGQPLLKNANQIWSRAQSVPVDQLPSVVKLYDLEPIRACFLFAGASRIGGVTIKNLVETFRATPQMKERAEKNDYTIEWIANQFKDYANQIYDREIPEAFMRPAMEIILSGYSSAFWEPEIWRLFFSFNRNAQKFECSIENDIPRKKYSVVFGGQYDVIQRVVNGIDLPSYVSLRSRAAEILQMYHEEVKSAIQSIDAKIELPKPDFTQEKYNIFGDDMGGITRIFSDVGNLSEQAGIDFVHFLVDVMIKSQEFASSIPTVGGKIHVAILTKNARFRWISKEAFRFENEQVPRY